MRTSAPAWAKPRAMALPKPLLPPVTRAARPDRSKSFASILVSSEADSNVLAPWSVSLADRTQEIEKNDRTDRGRDQAANQIRGTQSNQREEDSTQECTDDADDQVVDQAVAFALGDLAGEPAGGQANEQEKDEMDQAAHDDHLPSEESGLTWNDADPNRRAKRTSACVPMSARKFLPKGWEVGAIGSKFDQLLQPRVISNGLELGCNLFGLGAETCDKEIENYATLVFANSFAGPLSLEFLKYR